MVKFSLILPIILSSLYISFSLAQDSLSSCATNCSQTEGTKAGCIPGSLNEPTCVCTNAAFFGAASGCVWLSCTADEATTAESFWLGVCAAYKSSLAGSTATVSSSSGTRTAYGGYSSVTSRSATSNPYSYGSSSATSPSIPGYGSSSAPSSNTAYGAGSSSTPSPSTSNLAATMPTYAAALFAGGIGAMVAVFV